MSYKFKHIFAYYLPQFHVIQENNEWWGEGFTEWTNVKIAKKYHEKQVLLKPGRLGYYDLLNIKTIEAQYKLANQHSIDTFCFWHYWFDDNDLLLENPAKNILSSDIDINFCFAWANHSWFNKKANILLKEQKYTFSLEKYFTYLLDFFKDSRYRKIDNKPVFFIFKPQDCLILKDLVEYFNVHAKEAGFDGVYFVFENTKKDNKHLSLCQNFLNSGKIFENRTLFQKIRDKLYYRMARLGYPIPRFSDYLKVVDRINADLTPNELPVIFPCWDSTIRHGRGGQCLLNANPQSFENHLKGTLSFLSKSKSCELLVIKSWNEWAEGNVMEPSDIYGEQYLKLFSEYIKLDRS